MHATPNQGAILRRQANLPKPGEAFLEYRLVKVLGEGGMGVVFKAVEERSDDKVAIKCILPRYVDREDFAARFAEECKVYPKLKHPNIVRMRRSGVLPLERSGQTIPIAFIVMDLLEGRTLRRLLHKCFRIDPRNTLYLMIQIAEAMRFVHAQGIIHRDLKPENIMVGSQGEERGHVWVMDFGIAKDLHRSQSTEELPDVGTARYMAPEQAKGILSASKKSRRPKVDHRQDIYAFGQIFYETVTGKHTFIDDESDEPLSYEETLIGHLTTQPIPVHEIVPGCPEQLWSIVERCLATSPNDRYPTFEEVLRDMQDAARASLDPDQRIARHIAAKKAKEERQSAYDAMLAEVDDRARTAPPTSRTNGESVDAIDEEPRGRVTLPLGSLNVSRTIVETARAEEAPQRVTAPLVSFAARAPLPFAKPTEIVVHEKASAPDEQRVTAPLVGYVAPLNPLPFLRGQGHTVKMLRPAIDVGRDSAFAGRSMPVTRAARSSPWPLGRGRNVLVRGIAVVGALAFVAGLITAIVLLLRGRAHPTSALVLPSTAHERSTP